MVLRVTRGVGLSLLLVAGAVVLYGFGAGYAYGTGIVLAEPWNLIVSVGLFALLALFVAWVLLRTLRSSRAGFVITAVSLVAMLVAGGLYLVNFETTTPGVNAVLPFTRSDDPAVPRSSAFPVDVRRTGSGTFEATVANTTDRRATVSCYVEGATPDGDAVIFTEFKARRIPAGGTKTVTGRLDGYGSGRLSSGCKRRSY